MYTKNTIMKLVEDEDVEFIRLQFTDIFGIMKNMAVTAGQLQNAIEHGCLFDGAAVDGLARPEESDMYLKPDLDTMAVFPWRPQQGKVARLICDVMKPDGIPSEGDSRYILKKVIREAKDLGYTFNVGPECEFFLFHTDNDGLPTRVTHEQAGYFDLSPLDLGENARRDIILNLEEMGFEIESSHHEIAPAQHEIDFKYGDALKTADNIMTFKLAVKSIAKQHGLHATFMVCNVSEANIIENFSELDAYYQKGSYLISQEEYAKDIYSTHSVFPEEIHFLHIKFSLTNNGDKKRSFSPADLNLCSILDKDAAPIWPWKSFIVFDRQYMTQNGKKSEVKFSGQKLGNTNMVSEDISIQKGETIVVEFVGEFQEYEGNKSFYDYNLYLPIYDTGRKIITDPLGQKIHLNLERRYKGEKKTEEPVLYAEIRDIAAMKSRSWTNSELAEGQKGYFRHENIQEKVLQHEEGGEEYSRITNQEWRGKEFVQSYIKVIQALDYQVTDWENIPEDFAEQGNIENMAKRYNEVHGYKKKI